MTKYEAYAYFKLQEARAHTTEEKEAYNRQVFRYICEISDRRRLVSDFWPDKVVLSSLYGEVLNG